VACHVLRGSSSNFCYQITEAAGVTEGILPKKRRPPAKTGGLDFETRAI